MQNNRVAKPKHNGNVNLEKDNKITYCRVALNLDLGVINKSKFTIIALADHPLSHYLQNA